MRHHVTFKNDSQDHWGGHWHWLAKHRAGPGSPPLGQPLALRLPARFRGPWGLRQRHCPAVRRSSHSLTASVAVPAGWEGRGEHHSRQSTAHDLCSHDMHRHSLSRAMPSYIITWRRWSHTAGVFWPFMSVGPCVGWQTGQTGPRRYTASSRMVGAFLLNVYTL